MKYHLHNIIETILIPIQPKIKLHNKSKNDVRQNQNTMPPKQSQGRSIKQHKQCKLLSQLE